MDDDEINLNFGQSYINIYIPRDGDHATGQAQRNAPPPSPVLELDDGVYKFSEEVVKDRHMFLGRKPFYHRYSVRQQKYKKNSASKINSENMKEDNDDEHVSINVVKLAFDDKTLRLNPKTKIKHNGNSHRFNERLSAYVTSRKKIQSANSPERERTMIMSPRSPRLVQTPRSIGSRRSRRNENISTNTDSDAESIRNLHRVQPPQSPAETPIPQTPAPTTAPSSRRSRRQLTFDLNINTLSPAPSNYNTSFTPILRKSATPGKDAFRPDRMWLPENTSTSLLTRVMSRNSQYGNLPSRPSSKAHQIWRQSSDLLVSRKTPSINDVMPDKFYDMHQPIC